MTIWHYVKDLSAFYNWAIRKGYARQNPVLLADRGVLAFRHQPKLPLDPTLIEKGASCPALNQQERAYYNFLRFTGCRREEANKLEWEHLDLEKGLVLIPGKKNHKASALRPLPAILIAELKALPRACQWVFPSTTSTKCYDRRRMFIKVSDYVGKHITPKDLRDWFASQLPGLTSNLVSWMQLMRHTNLKTTTRYMEKFAPDLQQLVQGMGAFGGKL